MESLHSPIEEVEIETIKSLAHRLQTYDLPWILSIPFPFWASSTMLLYELSLWSDEAHNLVEDVNYVYTLNQRHTSKGNKHYSLDILNDDVHYNTITCEVKYLNQEHTYLDINVKMPDIRPSLKQLRLVKAKALPPWKRLQIRKAIRLLEESEHQTRQKFIAILASLIQDYLIRLAIAHKIFHEPNRLPDLLPSFVRLPVTASHPSDAISQRQRQPIRRPAGSRSAYNREEQREIVARYQADYEKGRIHDQETWAQTNYGITDRTLRRYLKKAQLDSDE